MRIVKSIRKFENKFDDTSEWFIYHHPFAGFLSVFVGIPLIVLMCVCIGMFIFALPLTWLLSLI